MIGFLPVIQAKRTSTAVATITYVGASKYEWYSGATNDPVVNYPTVAEDDIMICVLATSTIHNSTGTPPTGWTKIWEIDITSGDSTGTVFWKRAGASEPSSEEWTDIVDATESGVAAVFAYRNCVAAGSPIDDFVAEESASGTAKTISDLTTTGAGRMCVGILALDPDTTAPTCSWSAATERIDSDTTPDGDESTGLAAVYVADVIKATAGTQGFSATLSIAEEAAEFSLALIPANA